ncbi:helix-turn-helix transcriptional regulator [Marinicella sp. W31]|uniref:helix-turn-helix transcriptional regulator n=1 Tax=Marinicella sp. W31 TaxID=3023713 RepID=UPI003756810B
MLDISITTLSAAVIGISVTGALSCGRTEKDQNASIYLFITFLLFAGITSLPLVITFIPSLYIYFMPVLLPALLMLPVALYRFIALRTTDNDHTHFHWRDYLLPLAGLIVTIGFWLLPDQPRSTMLIQGELPPGFWPITLAIATLVLILMWCVTSVTYLAVTVKRLGTYRAHLKNVYSNTEGHELRWIDWLIVFLVTLWIASTIALISDNFHTKSLISLEFIYVLTGFVLLFLTTFVSTSPPKVNVQAFIDTPKDLTADSNDKYTRSALSDQHAKQLSERIDSAMRNDVLYLDPNLTLSKLSKHISALPNMVSQTLNEAIGSSFYDYVAHWRVEAAKPLIQSSNDSMLEISLKVGFNSRSTFYKAFKREVGMTPKAYRTTANP